MEKTKLLWGLTNLFYRNYSYFLHKKQLQQKKRIVFSIHTILNYTQHCQGDFFLLKTAKKIFKKYSKTITKLQPKKELPDFKEISQENLKLELMNFEL